MGDKNAENNCASDEDMDIDEAADVGIDSDEEGGVRIDEEIYIPPPPKKYLDLDANGPRLMIHKIVNENFKSYAGKIEIGPFDECFSSIIGPNGSGKSNTIDSMLFVFGYRSNKIRSKKISSLIHTSCRYPNVRSCTVSVHFRKIIEKPGGMFEAVPNSETIISRTAFKDNASYYELNGKKVQLKVIAKLLRSEGVDLDHNRFLILQGEVEQIALMKPKAQNENDSGMLEFLEDIIGTVRYKLPFEKLTEKLEILNERRLEKLNRLRVVELERNALQEPMQDAVQYLKMENTVTKLQHELFQCNRYETQQQIIEHETKKNEFDTDYAELTTEMKKVREQKDAKNQELVEKCKKWDVLQQKRDNISAQFDKIRKRDEALHAELVETIKRRKTDMTSLKTAKHGLEELALVPAKNLKDIAEYEAHTEKSLASREKEEQALVKLMEGLREKTEPLMNERKELETKLMDLRNNVSEAKTTYDLAESELNLYTSAEQMEKQQLEKLQETIKTTAETLQKLTQEIGSFELKIPATAKSLKEAEAELESVRTKEVEVNARLQNMRVQFEEQRSAMNASKSRNRVIDALMEEKRSGRIPGIFGRLGDLGAISAKYDVAISTACGPLDNVVVDTVQTAQDCILFLRENRIGRTSFIPLEKQQRYVEQCHQKIQTPENVPRLFDLIKVEDERVLPAFYYGLRDTLVANDLTQASRIAYGAQRYRVVTLKGDMIEIVGTMSGGGRNVRRGRMGQSVVRSEPSVADVEKLQGDLDTVYEESNRLRMRQTPLGEQIYALSTALKDMTTDRKKYEFEMKALRDKQPSLQAQLREQKKKATEAVTNPAKVKQLTKAVEAARANLERFQESSKSTEDAVAQLSKKIDDLSGGRIKEQQQKIKSLTKTIDKAKAEICRLNVAIQTAERNTKKTEQRIETLENNVKTCDQRIQDIQKEKTDIEEEAKVILQKRTELSEALTERDEVEALYKEELTAFTSRESKMKALKIDLDQKIRESGELLKELQKLLKDYTHKITSLRFHDIPGEKVEELKEFSEEEIKELDSKVAASKLQKAKQRLPEKTPNMQVIKDYYDKETAYVRRATDLNAITDERNKLRDIYDMAVRRRTEEFLTGFSIITGKLKEMYQMITIDGDAELELVDSMDPFSEGIVFTVRPPKKSWKNISNLSGGEKTLSSLALVFALHHYKPSPIYFMDEIDAALDFKNISIVGNYIKERAKNAQFIVVSLRENMCELANALVGIYKTYDSSESVTINVNKFHKKYGVSTINQNTQKIKNLYCSQAVRAKTQLSRPEPLSNDLVHSGAPVAATCPANSGDAEPLASTSVANLSLGLGDLGLPVTPEKQTSMRRNSNTTDIFEGTPEKMVPLKRRRL